MATVPPRTFISVFSLINYPLCFTEFWPWKQIELFHSEIYILFLPQSQTHAVWLGAGHRQKGEREAVATQGSQVIGNPVFLACDEKVVCLYYRSPRCDMPCICGRNCCVALHQHLSWRAEHFPLEALLAERGWLSALLSQRARRSGESQDEQYHGRTSLFLNEVKHGNFSLKLSNVQLQDKAVYSCIYSQAGHQTKKSQIKLSVSGKNLFLGQREGAGGSISCWQATYKQLQQLVWLSSIFKANLHLVALYSLLFLGEKNVKGIE